MNKDNILETARQAGLARPDAGMKVPAGYFEQFALDMSTRLPERPELTDTTEAAPRSLWERVRTYVYMAAMFAGIWLMMQMVNIMGGHASLAPMDSNPVLAEALQSDDFMYDYVYSDMSTYDVLDEMDDAGILDDTFPIADLGEDIIGESTYTLPQ